mgnify:CR=1 FL=1
MYQVTKRDGTAATFEIGKISAAITKAFQALDKQFHPSVIDLLALQGVRNAYSLITVPNEASLALHEKLGFTLMGVQKEAGYKLGAWHDVAWLRMAIGDFSAAPEPRMPLSAMDPDQVAEVLATAEAALARLN